MKGNISILYSTTFSEQLFEYELVFNGMRIQIFGRLYPQYFFAYGNEYSNFKKNKSSGENFASFSPIKEGKMS